jgi:hypothetical protein
MKWSLSGLTVAALLAAALSGCAEHRSSQSLSNEQNAPGTAGVSKPGVAGLPGSKSGPVTREPLGGSTMSSGPTNAQLQDQSKVPGLPGGMSGPAVRQPSGGTGSTTP